MFLELSARYMLERHRTLVNDPMVALRAQLQQREAEAEEIGGSGGLFGVAGGNRSRDGGQSGSNLARFQDLDPATGAK